MAWLASLVVCAVALAVRKTDDALLLQVFNLVEHAALALLSCLGVKLWCRFGLRGRRSTFVVLLLAANLVGFGVLVDDVTHFSERQSALLPPAVTRTLLITLISSVLPIAWLFAKSAQRWIFARVGLAMTAVGALAFNQFVLVADYYGVHLLVTLVAVTVLATVLTGAKMVLAARWSRTAHGAAALRHGLVLTGSLCAAVLVTLTPPGSVRSVWLKSNAAPLYRWLARVRGSLLGSPEALAAGRAGVWFTPRPNGPAQPAPAYPPLVASPIVFLITVDALRADVLDGRRDEQLPTFARLRKESVWFDNARAPGSLTKVSVTSLFMGKYFSQQHWAITEQGNYGVMTDRTRRFPEYLRDAGVDTINFRSINWLRNGSSIVKGFSEDTRVRSKRQKYTPSRPVFDRMIERLERVNDKPCFIHTHLSDAHAPYNLGDKKGPPYERYVSEVELIDHGLKRLLHALSKYHLEQRSILIIQADHGEAFGEHGTRTHGTSLYDEVLHVPLLIRVPGVPPRRVHDLVTTMDLGPTILELFREPVPGHFMGQSLVPYLKGESPELTRPVLAENRLQQAMFFPDGKKLIYDTRSHAAELYDLAVDPYELEDLSDDEELLQGRLDTLEAFFEVHRYDRDGYKPPFIR